MRADLASERVWAARPSVGGWTARRYRLLLTAQAVAAVGLAAGGTAGPLLAASIAGSETMAPVPLGLVALGSGVAALVLGASDIAAAHMALGGTTAAGMAGGGMAGGAVAVGAVVVVLVGLGWNLQIIGGTTLLVERSSERHRHRAEGFGELMMGLAAAAGTLGVAGPLLARGGLPALCTAVAAVSEHLTR